MISDNVVKFAQDAVKKCLDLGLSVKIDPFKAPPGIKIRIFKESHVYNLEGRLSRTISVTDNLMQAVSEDMYNQLDTIINELKIELDRDHLLIMKGLKR